MSNHMRCPVCAEEVTRDEADVGVGIIYGPMRCDWCGWCQPEDKLPEMLPIDPDEDFS